MEVLADFGELIYNIRLIKFEFVGDNIDTKKYFQDLWYFFLEKNFLIYSITTRGQILFLFIIKWMISFQQQIILL